MNYDDTQRQMNNAKWKKKPSLQRLHTVLFRLCDFLEKAKL